MTLLFLTEATKVVDEKSWRNTYRNLRVVSDSDDATNDKHKEQVAATNDRGQSKDEDGHAAVERGVVNEVPHQD